jgi:hypothetical protein
LSNRANRPLTLEELAALKAARSVPLVRMEDEPAIDPVALAEANARHDREHGNPFEWGRGWDKSNRKVKK